MISGILSDYASIYNSFYEIGASYPVKKIMDADRERVFDKALWSHFSDNGINGLSLSTKYGGKGFSALKTCIAIEALSKGCANNGIIFSSIAHMLACALPVDLFASETIKSKYLSELASGKWIAANAITESESGSDVYQMQSVGVKNGNQFLLNGEKCYITNAPISDVLLIYVATDKEKGFFGGISCFILPSKHKGITLSTPFEKMGLNSTQMGGVTLKDVALTEENLVGKIGAGGMIFSESMMWERTVMSAFLMGQLDRILESTINYAKSRTVAGRKLMDIQHVRHVLADVKTISYAGKNMVYDAAFAIDKKSKEALTKASAAKLFVSENVVNSIKQLQLLHGAYGYLQESELEREYRDCYASLIYSGTSAIQKNIISTTFLSIL